jgi:tripartite-type tricarboxylate transporter receptor subunit TctC
MLKNIFILGITAILLLCAASKLFAQGYPDRPITLVLPMAPGDGLDINGRLMGEELSKLLKIPISPLNKPGAGATLGTDFGAKAKRWIHHPCDKKGKHSRKSYSLRLFDPLRT